jgi:hypothetical protein
MGNEWAAVDDLMRELGSVRQAASLIRAESVANAAVSRAIEEAAEAVNQTIDAPRNPARLMAARDAIGVAEEVILALDREIGRSLRVRARAQALCDRAASLIDQATQATRIRFAMTERPREHARISDALRPLALSGHAVTVESLPASSGEEGWHVNVRKAGRAMSFRIPLGASSTEWDAAVRRLLSFSA